MVSLVCPMRTEQSTFPAASRIAPPLPLVVIVTSLMLRRGVFSGALSRAVAGPCRRRLMSSFIKAEYSTYVASQFPCYATLAPETAALTYGSFCFLYWSLEDDRRGGGHWPCFAARVRGARVPVGSIGKARLFMYDKRICYPTKFRPEHAFPALLLGAV